MNTFCTGFLNTTTTFTCSCKAGLVSPWNNGTSCGLPCLGGTQCGTNSVCLNNITCTCNPGYASANNDGSNCIPINNCEIGNGGCYQKCNFIGPATSNCSCNAGYSFNASNQSCSAINYCASNNGGCGLNSTCAYLKPGISVCSCNTGYLSQNSYGNDCSLGKSFNWILSLLTLI